jgi:hypothetical protein
VACNKCMHGKFSAEGATSCATCDQANYQLSYTSNAGEMTYKKPCQGCTPGTYGATATTANFGSGCTQCPAGYASSNPSYQTTIYSSINSAGYTRYKLGI